MRYFLLLLPLVQALQWPLSLQSLFTTPLRVAVIGAGAAGSSAAFFLSRGAKRLGREVVIDVYEKENHVGGRSTTVYPFDDHTLEPIELGASIFVDANKNMVRALSEWSLSTVPFENAEAIGIWDGEGFAVVMKGNKPTWWDQAKLLWRYGLVAPMRTQRLVKRLISSFLALYTGSNPPFDTVTHLSKVMGFPEFTEQNAKSYFSQVGIRGLFPEEVIDSAARVNYAQSLDEIHALGALVSMAASGAHSVQGGNWQVFSHMLRESGAKMKLNTTVSDIVQKAEDWQVVTSGGKGTYDYVLLAAPAHLSPYTLPSNLTSSIPEQPYVHLHVTLLVTRTPQARPEFFGLQEGATLPDMILTTSSKGKARVSAFNSISYHGTTRGGYICKIFSMSAISEDWLADAFGADNILWIHRKTWDAYPYLAPSLEDTYAPIVLAPGVYYVSAWEPWISTMETQSLAGRNIAELVMEREWDAEVGKTCNESLMRGWDC
ncbi:FAD/NADP-binding domain-containing protein [Dacryopinax primogenitus]|uniref:FAD/NADP-binding domain-containing protein n=1 Tax=Dacryopinax primogenitus (strain DJM 731) TaxID=1858805 RepID=M5FZY5_DACPD|nr:FAD/NADP-binding domain-containing protein [Dacryopinax primogenitus]EJT97077.1 FAD/NADP-binding domain-containing protein [Dacryopinax primogenitus]